MKNFLLAQDFTARMEGTLSDHKADPGGTTNYGISLKWLKSLGSLGDVDGDGDVDSDDIIAIDYDTAKQYYYDYFWKLPTNLDLIKLPIACCLYDMNVNHGPFKAAKIVQMAYNSILSNEKLKVDGRVGPMTIKALNQVSDVDRLINAIKDTRIEEYERLMVANTSLQVFKNGWIRRANEMAVYARTLI